MYCVMQHDGSKHKAGRGEGLMHRRDRARGWAMVDAPAGAKDPEVRTAVSDKNGTQGF